MKKIVIFSIAFIAVATIALASSQIALADKPVAFDSQGNEAGWSRSDCVNIQSGLIKDAQGNVITEGYDQYGYNYQAHMFNGFAGNYSRPATPVTSGDKLVMKWSDAWLANVDCDGDHKLDRGLVDGNVAGVSKGWLTNHYTGSYIDSDGIAQHYTDFVKIVWTGPGSPLWGQYTIIEEVWNDPAAGLSGLYSKLGAPGFGLNDQWTINP